MTALSGIVHGLDEATYHAHPALSSTQARQLLESPARFNYNRTHPQPHKDAFDLGTAVHTKVLGVGADVITYPDEHLTPSGAVSTKAATVAWAEEQRASGLVALTRERLALVDGMAEAVLTHPTARALLEQPGTTEASVFATDPDTGVDVRARFDFLPDLTLPNPIAVDLKMTGKTADKLAFERTVINFGYETQEVWYTDTLQLAVDAELPFVFVVVEADPPHLVGVHQLDVVFRGMGRDKAKRARDLYASCSASGVWPGHPAEVQLISPPTWAVFQHEEAFG